MRRLACLAILVLLSAIAAGEDDPARWISHHSTGAAQVELSAGGISGFVGFLSGEGNEVDEEGTSAGDYGTVISGTIGIQPAYDNKTKDNVLEQKWSWHAGSPEKNHQAGTVTAEITQDPSGSGASTIQTDPGPPPQTGYLASSYISKLHAVDYDPDPGATTSDEQLSLYYELNNTDSYAVSETLGHWRRVIDVAEADPDVRVTATSRAQGVVNGELCTVVAQELKLAITLNLPVPPPVEEEE